MNYYIGLGSGGTFMKAGLFDVSGKQIGMARVTASVVTERESWVERDLDALWANAAEAIARQHGCQTISNQRPKYFCSEQGRLPTR